MLPVEFILGTTRTGAGFAQWISAVAGGVVAAVALTTAVLNLRAARAQVRVLANIADEDKQDRVQAMDLPTLQTYLFETLGAMSIREYARDRDARRFVARAVDRVEEFLEEGASGGSDMPTTDHLTTAATAIQGNDLVTGVTHLRLAIQLRLRDVALSAGLPAEGATAGRLIDMLTHAGLLDPKAAAALSYAVKIGNRAVHGEGVDSSQAREALEATQRALDLLASRRVESP